ncbi:hypothetical protein LguiA_001547 [Lonicera macranthoides]
MSGLLLCTKNEERQSATQLLENSVKAYQSLHLNTNQTQLLHFPCKSNIL